MNASELIKQLEKIVARHGDCRVVAIGDNWRRSKIAYITNLKMKNDDDEELGDILCSYDPVIIIPDGDMDVL